MTTTLAVPTEQTPTRGLFRFAVFVAVFTLVHIKGGALVTSTGSGMAFTDWPLSNGSLWPPGMELPHYIEHLHRYSGAVLGMLSIALLWWIFCADQRRSVRYTAIALFVMICVQGLFGGLGVIYGQEAGTTWAPAAIVHGVLAQPTLCVAAVLALMLSDGWAEVLRVPASTRRTARKLTTIALGLVLVQLALGATARHADIQSALWLHVSNALVVALAILIAATYCTKFSAASPGFRKLTKATFIVLLLQLVLGFVTLAIRRVKDPSNVEYIGRSIIVSGHVVFGAILFLLATLLLAKSWRNLQAEA